MPRMSARMIGMIAIVVAWILLPAASFAVAIAEEAPRPVLRQPPRAAGVRGAVRPQN